MRYQMTLMGLNGVMREVEMRWDGHCTPQINVQQADRVIGQTATRIWDLMWASNRYSAVAIYICLLSD
jgi:hypothetical protein